MSEANPADGTDAGVTNVDIKQLLKKYDALPEASMNKDSDPMYVNVGPKQVGNDPTPGGSCIFIADRVRPFLLSIEVHILCSLSYYYTSLYFYYH